MWRPHWVLDIDLYWIPGPVLYFKLFLRKIFEVIVTIFQNTTIDSMAACFSACLVILWAFSARTDQFFNGWRSATGQIDIEKLDDRVSIIDNLHRQKVDEWSGLGSDENLDLRVYSDRIATSQLAELSVPWVRGHISPECKEPWELRLPLHDRAAPNTKWWGNLLKPRS
jgi:hypothetical protein